MTNGEGRTEAAWWNQVDLTRSEPWQNE